MRKTYLATCLLGALTLAACGGGSESETTPVTDGGNNGGGTGSGPVTETVSFRLTHGSLNVEERTIFTIEASSDVDGIEYAWDYTPEPGYAVEVNGSTVEVTVGELTQDSAFKISVTASADNYESSTESVSFSLREVDRAKLPPELTVGEATRTIEGVDSNSNGIRDDAERTVYELYESDYENRGIAWALTHSLQQQIMATHADDPDKAIEQATKMGLRTSYCLSEYVDEETRRAMASHVQNMMLDTPDRRKSFEEYLVNRGQVVVNVSDISLADCSALFAQE